jgi:hypothetical protein
VAAAAAFVAVLSSCGSSGEHKIKHLDVHGLAFAAANLDGGTVTINDAGGEQLASTKTDHGVFQFEDISLPADFRIVASGGTLDGKALTGSLKLDVRGYQPDRYLYVNEATTLVADYQAAHPTQTPAEVTATVRTFLGLPSSMTLGAALARPIAEFDHAKFAQAALADGGIDAYEAKLVAEIDSGAKGQRPKYPAVAKNGPEDSVAMFIAKGIANGLLSGGAQFAFNKAMAAAGLEPEDVASYLQTMSSQIQELDTQLTNQLSKNEYSTVHSALTTEQAIQVAASRQADEYTATDAATVAKDQKDVECYGLLLAGETQLPSGLSCAGVSVNGNYLTLLEVMDGSDGDTPLPQAFDAAWKANHSTYFYSSVDADGLTAQFETWKSLMSSQLAVISEALGEAGSSYSDDLTEISTATQKRLCDNIALDCTDTSTAGTVAKWAPPTFPENLWIQLANDSMWALGSGDGSSASFDTYDDWGSFIDEVNSSVEANPFQTFDPATGLTVTVKWDGWGLPGKSSVNALFGNWSGTTPGQWLDAQTGQVAHSLLGNWSHDKIWTTETSCGDGCYLEGAHQVWKLDSGLFTPRDDTESEYALLTRQTNSDGTTWTPLSW